MRRRILSSILLVTVLAVVLFGAPLALALRSLYLQQATLTLEREATEATRSVPSDFRSDRDVPQLPSPNRRVGLGLYDPTGHKVSGVGPATADASVSSAIRNLITDTQRAHHLVVSVPITGNERLVAVVRAQEGLGDVNARIYRAWALMGLIGAGSVAVAATVARRQARRLTAPIEEVREAASALGDGDFTVAVAPTGVRELDDVGDAITATAGRLGALIQRERAFSADASHQLRTPLTSLRLGIETELASPNPDLGGALQGALTQIDRLSETVDHLLELARNQPSPHVPIDVRELVQTVGNSWRPMFEAQGRQLTIGSDPGLQTVTGSSRAIGQILDVLISNALSHGEGTVRVEMHRVPRGTAFTVQDEGQGIDNPDLLFAGRTTSEDGHGIGLGLAQRLAEAEGGRITLSRSRPHPRFELVLTDDRDPN